MELLTADDVLKKTFQTTKFRDGYDIEEVDDFLDLVLGTLRELYSENERLKSEIAAAGEGATGGDSSELEAAKAALEAEVATLRDQLAAAETRVAEAELRANAAGAAAGQQHELEQARAEAAAAVQEAASLRAELAEAKEKLAAAPVAEPDAATGIISLAQQLHDDHVRQGQEEAARLVSEANQESARIVTEAETKKSEILNELEQQRGTLESKIEDLKTFEADYRSRLEASLKSMLQDLETGPNVGN